MTTIAIVYFSGYGHTAKQAEAVHQGAASHPGATATLYRIDANGELPAEAWEAISSADAMIYGSPTYMGGPAWQFKKFADASSKPWFTMAWKDKVAAGFTNSASINGDKFSTIQYLWTLAQQHGQILGRYRTASRQHQGPWAHRCELDGRICRRTGGVAGGCVTG